MTGKQHNHDKNHPHKSSCHGKCDCNDCADDATPAEEPIADNTAKTQVDELSAVKAERDDLLARLQRLSADFANYQKRSARDVEQSRQYANEELMKALLPVLDDIDRAIDAGKAAGDENNPLLKGLTLAHDNAAKALANFGLKMAEVNVGDKFDPTTQSAVMQQHSDDLPEMAVVQVMQKCYQLKDRTIRPAMVIVSKGPAPKEEQA